MCSSLNSKRVRAGSAASAGTAHNATQKQDNKSRVIGLIPLD